MPRQFTLGNGIRFAKMRQQSGIALRDPVRGRPRIPMPGMTRQINSRIGRLYPNYALFETPTHQRRFSGFQALFVKPNDLPRDESLTLSIAGSRTVSMEASRGDCSILRSRMPAALNPIS